MKHVGIAGLGLLGSAIAERLKKAGLTVTGCDPDPRNHLLADRVVASARGLNGLDAVILCLPDSAVTAQVLPSLSSSALVIDTATGSPQEMAAFGAGRPAYLDCTVAASSVQVRNHDATLMCGGRREAFELAKPLLGAFGDRIFYAGPCGSGARMKLVVNLALGLQRAVLGEALGFAESCGIDPAQALQILKVSPAYAKAMDTKGARMLERRYSNPDARLRQHHKDVRLILEEASRTGARVPLSLVHDQLLAEAEKAGFGEEDNSAIREVFDVPSPG